MLENLESEIANTAGRGLPVRTVAENGGFDAWQSLCAPFSAIVELQSARLRGRGGFNAYMVGPLGFVNGSCGAHLVRRSEHQVSDTAGFVLVTHYRGGRVTGMMDGTPFYARSGDLALRDLDHPFEALRYPSTFESVLIPRQMLGVERGQVPGFRTLPNDDIVHQAVRGVFRDLFSALTGAPGGLAENLMQRLLVTVRKALFHPGETLSPRQLARQAQMRDIEHCIENNLGRLDLSAETLLPEFGLSRATLYRLFEAQGGVRSYIVDRRLFRALLEISDRPMRRGRIQQAAKRWGFSSPSNFNRSVQQMFGASPGALLKAPENRTFETAKPRENAPAGV